MEVLRGRIENLTATRQSADFVFTGSDQHAMGATAILAGMAGMSGQAIGMGAIASDTQEAADYLEFTLGDNSVRGWLWRSPFKEGDEVEAAVIAQQDYYEVYAVTRLHDRLIALYPHCLRGKSAHVKNALRLWRQQNIYMGMGVLLLMLGVGAFNGGNTKEWILICLISAVVGGPIIWGWVQYRVANRWMKFARLAEEIFAALGFDKPTEVDLPRNAKKIRKKGDPFELGLFYFRY